MKTYTVYFELFGKKMKYEVNADSERDAMEKIKSKIIFYKVKEVSRFTGDKEIDDIMEKLFKFL